MRYLLIFSLIVSKTFAQYNFSGKVNPEFYSSTIYLLKIDDYSKGGLFLTENILQKTEVDSIGNFSFKGKFLPTENRFYKIYIDSCESEVTDYNHLITVCDNSNSILFIANNQDSIYFPLNNLNQTFCSIEYSRNQNIAIQKIDSIQEFLLHDLSETKSDGQRKIIFKNYLKEIQNFSESLEEPLAELYSFNLYANRNSFGRNYYLEDIKSSDYYSKLANRLEQTYPNTSYTSQYKQDILTNSPKKESTNYTVLLLSIGLIVSLSINFYFLSKKTEKKKTSTNYKELLSPQEQKVFVLMGQKKN